MAKRRRLSRRRFKRTGRRMRYRRLRRTIKRVIMRTTEVKWSPTTISVNYGSLNSLFVQQINPQIVGGTGKNQRIGHKIRYKRMTVNFDLFLGNLAGTPAYLSRLLRVLIIQPRVNFATLPITNDVFDQASYLSNVVGTKWRVLYDKQQVLVPSGSSTQLPTESMHFQRKLHFRNNNNVTYKDMTETTPSDPKDIYYFCFVTDQLGAGVSNISVLGNISVRQSFIDL